MIRRQHVVHEFFAEAEAMREVLDKSFQNPYTHGINWQYFCDPRMYTYLRTMANGVMPETIFKNFMQRLRQWCLETLGLVPIGTPYLHLMVNGCRLGLHSDFHNGAWGYVYSLTRWQERKFLGGETLLLRDGIPSYKRHHVQGEVLYELIPAQFNQLLVFDDRLVHGTPTIEGSMDPREGRIALVGHIRATSLLVTGFVQWDHARKVVLEGLQQLRDRLKSYKDVQGTVAYRLTIGTTGRVESITSLTENVVTPVTGYEHSDAVGAVKSIVLQTIAGLKFPTNHSGNSTVIVPVLIPIPDLRPIEFAVPHNSSPDAICGWIKHHLADHADLELQGDWNGDALVVREPLAGTIHVGSRHITVSLDPPMWVPSQREHFQTSLTEWIIAASRMALQ
jgi:hypothetical protein